MSSQSEVNKTVAVLTGSRLKFTVTIIKKSGVKFEMQTDRVPSLDYSYSLRTTQLITRVMTTQESHEYPICDWADVEAMMVEENK